MNCMTTLLGIKTNSGLEGVVFFADRQKSVYSVDEMDEMEKTSIRKLYT